MTSLKISASGDQRAAVIGDVVSWRRVGDRTALLRRLDRVLAAANDRFATVTPWRVTVGDEFQASFAGLGEALRASSWVSLALADDAEEHAVEVRHGIGWGGAEVLEREPFFEDGPAWWAARDAIDDVEAQSRRPGLGTRRTSFRLAPDVDGPDPALVEALLVCRDQVVQSLSTRSRRLLRGVLEGRSQAELAASEGISASAVSQRVRRDGITALAEVDELLRRVR